MRQADHAEAGRWLARHGLADVEPTPLLAARLAVRRRAKLADSLLLAAFLIGAALTHALRLTYASSSWLPLLALTALVVGLLVAQWLLRWWVRRVDQRAGAQLSRRVAHPVKLGWPAVLDWPYTVFTVAAFTSAVLLAVSVLPVPDSGLRFGAIVVLIGLAGAGAGTVMQLRQVLASPAVAEDEASLTADVVMRVEDARALVTPSLVWSLPAIFLYGESLGWWNAVALALVVVGVLALSLIQIRTSGAGTAARRAMATR
ncbi:hypothetical protein [Micromonospora endophytica]|uniref:Uncharacterized protein n=1 Tax=Micromonospora endophytica TaxID=515350 RepID=A0A2W2D9Y4_9ACTN|nr:hypothetical protein [Micromonospora endophytica]PZG00729.1 hypothetical protein C1I93_01705 [Micromonospora endophytica]RIW44850.1 hypothetical protein D3H59_16850 [Micromonospora endophytica]BCJ57582.1 hypothetical protein Jiend_10040 [Micromonospora endophytica]